MESPLVSILIPAYNAERYVAQTLESAHSQTWPRLEIIVVDDGSRDQTLGLARRFESVSVKVVTQENRGASSSRNRALSLAQGEYIQWLDADDLLAPDKIERQMEVALQEADPSVLFSSEFGQFFHRPEKAKFVPNPLWKNLEPAEWMATKFANNTWMNPAVWLVSRRLSEEAGPWNEELTLDDDGEYFCRLVSQSRLVRFVPGARSYYRQWNTGSLSRASSEKACRSLLQSLKLSIGYLRSLEDSARTREAALSYLQVWYFYFFPDKKDLLAEIDSLAHELGGRLSPPALSWKYSWIKGLFGWEEARRAKDTVATVKLKVRSHLDRVAGSLFPVDTH